MASLTKVTIEFFKTSGKYGYSESFFTILKPHQREEITKEVKKKFEVIKNYDFTVEVELGKMWNKWLIKKE